MRFNYIVIENKQNIFFWIGFNFTNFVQDQSFSRLEINNLIMIKLCKTRNYQAHYQFQLIKLKYYEQQRKFLKLIFQFREEPMMRFNNKYKTSQLHSNFYINIVTGKQITQNCWRIICKKLWNNSFF
ncbi:unnamed protein product [Paramecium pentaurelia]|uniref:Uncharacterized protein n=1 Tax=Paramecium pentaurelia TaxID=43138 RepID=A0A8S1YM70_9CILI|nr:unnamed protein product [Paramecium pentaurelia]